MKMMWPFSASNFRISWISGRNNVIAPGFRIRKFPWSWLLSVAARFSASSTINPPRYASFSLPSELDAASGLIFSCPRVRFPCRALSIPGFTTQSDGSRMRYLSRQWKSGSSPRALILPQSCLLLFVLVSSSPSFWCSQSGWNGWCWTNETDCFTHHVWNYFWSICLRDDVWCRCTLFESWDAD